MAGRRGILARGATSGLLIAFGAGATASADIWWGNPAGSIGHAESDGTGPDGDFITGAGSPYGITADGTYVYWANRSGDAIGRAPLDGGGTAEPTFVSTGISDPRGVVVIQSGIYFTHVPSDGEIGRVDLDGTNVQSSYFINPGAATGPEPCGLTWSSDRILYANQGSPGSIGRSHTQFFETNEFITQTDNPCGVAAANGFIYWTNQDSDSIGRANPDGSGLIADYIQLSAGTEPCAVAVDDDRIYWTSVGHDEIGRAEIAGPGPITPDEDFIDTGVTDSCGLTTSPTVEATPSSADFADTTVGNQSDGVALFVANRSSSTLAVSGVSVIGAHPDDFEIVESCSGRLTLAGCLINVNFTPTAPGDRTATLEITSNAENSPTDIPLSGTGVAPPTNPPPADPPPPEPPPAEPTEFARTLSISYRRRAERFKGSLGSQKAECTRHQKVVVFERRRGVDARLGSDTTDAVGRWRLGDRRPEGRFYALTKQSTPAGVVTCLAAKSETLKLR